MCGIVGVAGDLTMKDRDVFEDMLDVCQVRGRDSTGAIRVDRQGNNYTSAKRVGPPTYLFDSREYDRNIRQVGTSALIGHCRHKTVGDNTVANAHPFDITEHGIVGVHNGTLKNYYRFPEHQNGKVDSLILYERIAKYGAEEAFADIEGAYACVWWDNNEHTLNFIRNKERPLWFTYSEDQRKMYWASEAWMFGAVYRGEKLWSGTKDGNIYISLEEDVLYRLKIDSNAAQGKPVFKVLEGKKIEKKPQPAPVTRVYGNTTTHHGAPNRALGSTSSNVKTGGEVTSPFLNDDLPQHLTVSAKQSDKTTKLGTTSKNNDNSSTPLKNSSALSQPSTSTETLLKLTHSPNRTNLLPFPKTNRKKLSVVSEPSLASGSDQTVDGEKIYQANVGTDTRYIQAIDTEFITDMRTGREVSEGTFRQETGGHCCHCQTEIHSLVEVAEIFDEGKRFICVECVTPKAEPTAAVSKEFA